MPITKSEARAIMPIPSSYRTNMVYRLERIGSGAALRWELRGIDVPRALHREYDGGDFDDWIAGYQSDLPPDTLKFVTARREGLDVGLLTWTELTWNNTIWLVDIRARGKRQGIGSALLDWLFKQTRAIEARGIVVETQTSNAPAVQFYLKHGFDIAGFNDHLYSNEDLDGGEVALWLFRECSY